MNKEDDSFPIQLKLLIIGTLMILIPVLVVAFLANGWTGVVAVIGFTSFLCGIILILGATQ